MSGFIETVRVRSDNPSHQPEGFYVKNLADLRDDEVIFGAEPKAPGGDQTGDQFDAMDKDALKAFLTEKGVEFHHMTGEVKLRELARGVTASDELV